MMEICNHPQDQVELRSLLDLCSYNNEMASHAAVIWRDPQMSMVDVIATYKDVFSFATGLLLMLQKHKVEPSYIAVQVEPTISSPSIILGILQHGSAFVCLDASKQSGSWNENICDKLRVQWMFTDKSMQDSSKWTVVGSEKYSKDTIFLFKINKFEVSSADIVMQSAPATFDPSVVELFLAISSGATLLMVPHSVKQSPTLLAKALLTNPTPTVIQATPSLIRSLGPKVLKTSLLGDASTLRVLAFGGEPCPSLNTLSSWRGAANHTRLFNLYGVTEVSCWSTCHEITLSEEPQQQNLVPLGEPFPYTRLQVRDKASDLVSCGEGELHISNGERMCTAESQVTDKHGVRWCATGDLVRKVEDGTLYYLGRCSDARQLKRWGRKVSLQELESTAMKCPHVQACHAVSNISSSLQLVIFVTSSETDPSKGIRTFLRRHLPSFAQPDAVICVPQFPLTHHGKIDNNALRILAGKWDVPHMYPKNETDIKDAVRAVWQSTLLLEETQVEDDALFLASGGDSALAALVAAELLRVFEVIDPEQTLVTAILDKSFQDICITLLDMVTNSGQLARDSEKHPSDSVCKKPRLNLADINVDIPTGSSHVWKLAECDQENHRLQFSLTRGKCDPSNVTSGNAKCDAISIEPLWKYEMVKCIDASPLVLQFANDSCLSVIGSHSGKVVCVDVKSGHEIWSVQLRDRIESSANVTPCGQFVCLVDLQSGALLASPCIVSNQAVLVATLGGAVVALDVLTGVRLWTKTGSKPYFASPIVLGEKLAVIGDVTGLVVCINICDGQEIWNFMAKGNVFSSFTVLSKDRKQQNIIFGCSAGNVYCLDETGSVLWISSVSGRVTSTPFVFQYSNPFSDPDYLVALITAAKQMEILNCASGLHVAAHYKLSEETFSSPVIINNYMLLGSRDNYFHCFSVNSKQTG
ncbi:hypothetical protein B566_EDAN001934 [Ephemera danica]|nr:hypothetical protein B566_EDAN001934 [Ephemera danica]